MLSIYLLSALCACLCLVAPGILILATVSPTAKGAGTSILSDSIFGPKSVRIASNAATAYTFLSCTDHCRCTLGILTYSPPFLFEIPQGLNMGGSPRAVPPPVRPRLPRPKKRGMCSFLFGANGSDSEGGGTVRAQNLFISNETLLPLPHCSHSPGLLPLPTCFRWTLRTPTSNLTGRSLFLIQTLSLRRTSLFPSQ